MWLFDLLHGKQKQIDIYDEDWEQIWDYNPNEYKPKPIKIYTVRKKNFESDEDILLDFLQKRKDKRTSSLTIVSNLRILQYNRAIHRLRKIWHNIVCKIEWTKNDKWIKKKIWLYQLQ